MEVKETILTYDIEKYDFRKMISALYVTNLENLHNCLEQNNNQIKGIGNDSDTILHKIFYDKLREGWMDMIRLYETFIRDIILPVIEENTLIYQKFPTYRIHLPNNKVISDWHCDSDENYNHPKSEINFILPLTKAYDTNTIWIESEPKLKDFHPVNMDYGDLLMFNGNECTHGNKINRTGICRVSFDFRVIPKSKYNKNYMAKTATKGLNFIVGEYYKMMHG